MLLCLGLGFSQQTTELSCMHLQLALATQGPCQQDSMVAAWTAAFACAGCLRLFVVPQEPAGTAGTWHAWLLDVHTHVLPCDICVDADSALVGNRKMLFGFVLYQVAGLVVDGWI